MPSWDRLDQAARDRAYDNSGAVPGSDALQQARAEHSAKFRALRRPIDIAYGKHNRQRVDVFAGGTKMLVFIHGGYWQRGGREMVSVLAEGPLALGWSVAFPGYRLAPEANLDDIVADIGAAVDLLANRFGRLTVAGHSAGGCLAALALEHEAVNGALAISGVYELAPLRQTFLNQKLALTQAQEEAWSPLRRPLCAKPLTLAYGGDELPALVANSRDFHAVRSAQAAPGALHEIPGANHFSVLDTLRDPDGLLCRALPT